MAAASGAAPRTAPTSMWKRPSADDRMRRLSDDWYPGEWLEPVEPDIVKPFLERYMDGMSRRMAAYLRMQGADGDMDGMPDESDESDGAAPPRRTRGIDFLNLCLIIDQDHTFSVGGRNLAASGYEPDEETTAYAAMTLQLEFDGFVDFVAGLDPHIDRRGFVTALREAYGYEGDIDSPALLGVLASRAAARMAREMLRRWSASFPAYASDADGERHDGEDTGGIVDDAWLRAVRGRLGAWGLRGDLMDDKSGVAVRVETRHAAGVDPAAMLESARGHWVRRIAGARRNTPRRRDDVAAWCVAHATLEAVWRADRQAYDARWHGVDVTARDSRTFDALPPLADEADTTVTADGGLDGSSWNTLMGRMTVAHRRVSRAYARWCDMMPTADDTAEIRLAARAVADDPAFTDRVLAAACNARIRGGAAPAGDAREAMRMLLAYACVGLTVSLDGSRASSPSSPGMADTTAPGEYVYVGLRNAILGYAGYRGRRCSLSGREYRDYVALIAGGQGASPAGDDGRHDVWIFPAMEERFATVQGEMETRVRAATAAGFDLDAAAGTDAAMPDAWWRFHDVADKAVSRWLGGETIHAAAVDGHGHTLAYRASNPVAAYQDVNAWRLGEALERYEGERVWGGGGRLADLYRDRGHLSKSGGKAADRSIRDYAASAQGAGDAVQYLAAVTGLGAMLESERSVELFIRLIDLCDERGGERFRKSCWTLIRVAKTKRMRLTVPCAHGRRVGAKLLALALDDPQRAAETEHELKIANLRRAFGKADDDAGDTARMIDMAEHTVRGVVLAAFARLRAADRRWAATRVAPAACIGSLIDPASDGACVFRDAAAASGTYRDDHRGDRRDERKGATS